jgi:hypothetical protein
MVYVRAAGLHNKTAGITLFSCVGCKQQLLTCLLPCTQVYTPCRAADLVLHIEPAALLDLLAPFFFLSVCLAWMAGKHSLLHCPQTSRPETHAAKRLLLAGVRICALCVCFCWHQAERLQPFDSCTSSRWVAACAAQDLYCFWFVFCGWTPAANSHWLSTAAVCDPDMSAQQHACLHPRAVCVWQSWDA